MIFVCSLLLLDKYFSGDGVIQPHCHITIKCTKEVSMYCNMNFIQYLSLYQLIIVV